jgi:hypothetical protein
MASVSLKILQLSSRRMAGKCEFTATCACGEFQIQFNTSKVLYRAICHCPSCMKYNSQATSVVGLPEDAFTVLKGDTHVKVQSTPGFQERSFCGKCGVRLYNHTTGLKMVGTYPATWDDIPRGANYPPQFAPTCHVHYGNRLFDTDDSLVKFQDFPKAFGGSGVILNPNGEPTGETLDMMPNATPTHPNATP